MTKILQYAAQASHELVPPDVSFFFSQKKKTSPRIRFENEKSQLTNAKQTYRHSFVRNVASLVHIDVFLLKTEEEFSTLLPTQCVARILNLKVKFPFQTIEPIVNTIANNFVTERNSGIAMAVG